jgi:lysozyme
MNVSEKAIHMICHHEGVRYKPYQCPAKLWTVGVGHVIDPNHGKLTIDQRKDLPIPEGWDRKLTREEVDGILRRDLDRFERGVEKFCPVALTQGMFDGLVSFSFNVGLGTLQRSTLRQKLLRGDKEGAAEELLKYCMAGGKILKGLQNRRIDERALFLS